jgi:tRNA A-37 threonylcarbamoyl transferase component Bud32
MTEESPRVQCPVCKQILAPGARFCPHDGTPLTETSAHDESPTPTGDRPRSRQITLPVVVGNRYRLVAQRGGGGMAKVYKAEDLTLGREVAVKLINPELRTEKEFDNRFQREARIASQLSDPHIVVVHDFGLDPDHGPYLVMEYLHGQSLRERLASGGPLPLKAGLQLTAQLLLALIHAHEKNVVHRDIKPDNIFLLNQSGVRLHIRVLDFGIARIFRSDEPANAETLTSPGAVLGTPRYMSPEQLAGQPVNARSDLYSAAMVVHEALTGQLPYVSGKTLCELCPDATPALEELLDRCLRPNPNERPNGALEVYLQLQELGKASGVVLLPPGALDKLIAAKRAESPTVAAPATPQGTTVVIPSTRRRLLYLAAGLVALTLLVGFVWHMAFPRRDSHAPIGAETLLGIQTGDSFTDTVDRWQLTHGPEYPWRPGRPRPACLGTALNNVDLGGHSDEVLERAEVRWSPDEGLAVVGLDNRVLVVVLRKAHRGETRRGVKIGSAVADVYHMYDDDDTVRTDGLTLSTEEGGGHGEVRRYDTIGLGFVIHKGRVSSILLYPPRSPR